MKQFAIVKDGKIVCSKANSLITNKKTIYCKNCESQFAGVCRHLLDTNY